MVFIPEWLGQLLNLSTGGFWCFLGETSPQLIKITIEIFLAESNPKVIHYFFEAP